ncbi:hypothetical protein EPH_0013100 [Eimeria praecox]|uniref:Uncharacterized protein n=1 Tax=Eimeria praecox TaxID=51316 RepID=U6GX24_9EIME|nr:hypothetical protein EPH_0013100 [Eimeria praecox]
MRDVKTESGISNDASELVRQYGAPQWVLGGSNDSTVICVKWSIELGPSMVMQDDICLAESGNGGGQAAAERTTNANCVDMHGACTDSEFLVRCGFVR